jgi:type IV pilus assembly protein PilM
LSLFSLTQDRFGLDIGSSVIKLVQLNLSGGRPSLVTYGSATIPLGFSQSDSEMDIKRMAEIIKELARGTKVTTKNVNIAISEHEVFSIIISVPQMPRQELADAIKWQSAKNLPVKIEEVKLDWQILNSPQSKDEPLSVLVIAAPISRVQKILRLSKEADLNLVAIETSASASARSVANFPGANIIVIDIGAMTTEISLVRNKALMFSRSVTIGGEYLTRSVAKSLGLDAAQADQFKRKFGATLDKLEGKVYRSLNPVLGMITDEVTRFFEYIELQFSLKPDLVVLSGGTAKMPEIKAYFENTLKIKTEISNPWSGIVYPQSAEEDLSLSSPDFAVAVGLALREGK